MRQAERLPGATAEMSATLTANNIDANRRIVDALSALAKPQDAA
jgi:hypothetical protein